MNDSTKVLVKKVLDLGKVDGYGNGRKSCRLTLTLQIRQSKPHDKSMDIDLNPITEPYVEVSIVGDVWNNTETDIIEGGQIQKDVLNYIDNKKTRRIVELWKRWHLNDMKAGTRLQRECLATYDKDERYDYDTACGRLLGHGLYNDRGYKYGHAWFLEVVPDDVLIELCELFGADVYSLEGVL